MMIVVRAEKGFFKYRITRNDHHSHALSSLSWEAAFSFLLCVCVCYKSTKEWQFSGVFGEGRDGFKKRIRFFFEKEEWRRMGSERRREGRINGGEGEKEGRKNRKNLEKRSWMGSSRAALLSQTRRSQTHCASTCLSRLGTSCGKYSPIARHRRARNPAREDMANDLVAPDHAAQQGNGQEVSTLMMSASW